MKMSKDFDFKKYKQEYNRRSYSRISADLPKKLVEEFNEKADITRADLIRNAVKEYLNPTTPLRFQSFLKSAIKFAQDTAEWYNLTESFYTDDGNDDWRESCDNQHGGLDVSWAFHKTTAEVRAEALGEYFYQVGALVEGILDGDELNVDYINYVLKFFDR